MKKFFTFFITIFQIIVEGAFLQDLHFKRDFLLHCGAPWILADSNCERGLNDSCDRFGRTWKSWTPTHFVNLTMSNDLRKDFSLHFGVPWISADSNRKLRLYDNWGRFCRTWKSRTPEHIVNLTKMSRCISEHHGYQRAVATNVDWMAIEVDSV